MTTNTRTRMFFPLTKVDAEQRLVYGRITSETVDKANEILDYDGSKPYFEKWSQGISKATDGKSLGNVRSMHQPIAAGKLVDIIFDDLAKTIDCCAKIIDETEWQKCLEGVYTGFSMGGNYVKRWADETQKGVKRFIADPIEVSIVDNPCVGDATFSMVKAGGLIEEVEFATWNPSNDDVVAKARELGTAAGVEDFADYIEPARKALIEAHAETVLEETPVDVAAVEKAEVEKAEVEGEEAPAEEVEAAQAEEEAAPEAGVEPAAEGAETPAAADETSGAEGEAEKTVAADPAPLPALKQVQLWEAPDGKRFEKKADAKKHREALEILATGASPLAAAIAKATAAANPSTEETAEVDLAALGDEADSLSKALTQLEAAATPHVHKSMWNLSSLAEALARLNSVCHETVWEVEYNNREDSTVTTQLAEGISVLGAALVEYAREEVAEMVHRLQERGVDIVEIVGVEYVEAAAAISVAKADEALMSKVGARHSKKDLEKLQGTHDHMVSLGAVCAVADKAADGTVAKAVGVTDETLREENAVLKRQIEEAVPAIAKMGDDMRAMRTELEALKKTPAPMPSIEASGGKVVTKAVDNGGGTSPVTTIEQGAAALKSLIENVGIEKLQGMLLDEAFANPIQVR